jgi:hypothetical protein
MATRRRVCALPGATLRWIVALLATTAALPVTAALEPIAPAYIPSTPAGHYEAGVPAFTIVGPESIGISSLPTGLHLLNDGRVLVTSQREIAFGDGVRWDAFRAADGQAAIYRDAIADTDGTIYFGSDSGIERLEIGTDGQWRAVHAMALPNDPRVRNKTMVAVEAVAGDWFWHSSGGDMVAWRPGKTPRVVPNLASVEHLFELKGQLYASDSSSGALYCLSSGNREVPGAEHISSELITASAPLDADHLLIGTY